MDHVGDSDDNLSNLISILQLAYSGERAAAYAYRGHWNSVRNPDERTRIEAIETEEWHHRNLVGEMLSSLGARPDRVREVRAAIIGRILQALCHVSGWLAPMYGAGKLESRNIGEYEAAARFASGSGHVEFVDCLLTMAEVEWEHEHYFRSRVLSHPARRLLPIWPLPAPKANIRSSFARETARSEDHQSEALVGSSTSRTLWVSSDSPTGPTR